MILKPSAVVKIQNPNSPKKNFTRLEEEYYRNLPPPIAGEIAEWRFEQEAWWHFAEAEHQWVRQMPSFAQARFEKIEQERQSALFDSGSDGDDDNNTDNNTDEIGNECVICMETQRGYGETVATCGHSFHSACIARWIRTNPNCPTCNSVWVNHPRPNGDVIVNYIDNIPGIYLPDTQLNSVPQPVFNHLNIQRLILRNNQITSLPDSIGNMNTIRTLILDRNRLTTLPETLSNLRQIQTINCARNRMERLPTFLMEGLLNPGCFVLLRGNPLEECDRFNFLNIESRFPPSGRPITHYTLMFIMG
jgi:hypothetical protein